MLVLVLVEDMLKKAAVRERQRIQKGVRHLAVGFSGAGGCSAAVDQGVRGWW